MPDRTAEVVLPWLHAHPEIEVVSRDRASAYADAATKALPHATQVADRFHLCKNLREYLQQVLDRKRTCLPIVSDTPLKAGSANGTGSIEPPEALLPSPASASAELADRPLGAVQPHQPVSLMKQEGELSSLTYRERKKKISRDKRSARYEQVMALHRTGMGQRAIARQLGTSRQVVQRFVSSLAFPERAEGTGRRAAGKSKLAPYLSYLRECWAAGTQNGSRLFREIKHGATQAHDPYSDT